MTSPGTAVTAPVTLTQPLPQGVQAQGLGAQGEQVRLKFDPIPAGETVGRPGRLQAPGPAG